MIISKLLNSDACAFMTAVSAGIKPAALNLIVKLSAFEYLKSANCAEPSMALTVKVPPSWPLPYRPRSAVTANELPAIILP